jgi:hypothetical protein
MEFYTYNKIHFRDIVEIRILIRVEPLMDIAMYSINPLHKFSWNPTWRNSSDICFVTAISKEA